MQVYVAKNARMSCSRNGCKYTWEKTARILGLQPRDKAAMLGVKTKEYFLEEFT